MKIGALLKFSEALKKAAAACAVRECDEEQPGRFVAYVDEGDRSYDVTLHLDADRQPLEGSCDCDAKKPCRHIAALFQFVNDGRTVTAKVAPNKVRKKKQTPAEALLEQVDNVALRAWLVQMFAARKELEMAFISRFRDSAETLGAEEVIKLSADAAKTALGRMKKADPSQLKRILQLWKDLHKPVLDRYRSAPAEREAFEPLKAVMDAALEFNRANVNGARMLTYAREILTELAPVIAPLHQDEAFQTAATFFTGQLATGGPGARLVYPAFLDALWPLLSRERLQWIAQRVGDHFCLTAAERKARPDHAFSLSILRLVQAAGMFSEFDSCFDGVVGADIYNLELLDALIESGNYRLAAEIGWDQHIQMRSSSRGNHYLERVKIAELQAGNEAGLVKVLKELFPRTYLYEDYERILASVPDESARKKLAEKLRKMAEDSRGYAAGSFLAKHYSTSGNWNRFYGTIRNGSVPYSAIVQFFPALFQQSAPNLLAALLGRSEGFYLVPQQREAEEEDAAETLVEKMIGAYGRSQLKAAVLEHVAGQAWRWNANLFIRELRHALDPEP